MTESVLVPIDGSELSWRALEHALTRYPDADVTVLHVVDLYEPGYVTGDDVESSYEPLVGTDAWYERADERSQGLFAEAEQSAADHDRSVGTASEIGDPERVIVDYLDEEDVDHVVMGSHGRTDEGRHLFGSTAETVARRSTATVTLVR